MWWWLPSAPSPLTGVFSDATARARRSRRWPSGSGRTRNMTLNPITYTENVVGDFLKYQLTTYGFADPRLREQLRRLLSLDETRRTPLLHGPHISLSRGYRAGASVAELGREGVLHSALAGLVPHSHLFGHQERAIRASRRVAPRWSRRARAPARPSASSIRSSATVSPCAMRARPRACRPSSCTL